MSEKHSGFAKLAADAKKIEAEAEKEEAAKKN